MHNPSQTAQLNPRKEFGNMNAENSPTSDLESQRNSPKTPIDPSDLSPPPPNGGLVAWLQVAAAFAVQFNTWGFVSSFGTFQTYYESGELFKASSARISWIGCTQNLLILLLGLIAGPVYDRGYLRQLLCVGSFIAVSSFIALSFSKRYYQVFLSQGVGLGLGSGLLFAPTMSLVSTYFSTRAGLALGIASSGSPIGGIVYPIMLSGLIPRIGFPWAVRAMGFIALGIFLLPLAVMRIRVRAPKPRAVVDWSAFRDTPYMFFLFGVFLSLITLPIVSFYISFYPLNRGFTNRNLAFHMVAIHNVGSFCGRILPNALSDHIGVFNTLAPSALLLGVAMISFIRMFNAAGIITGSLVTGFFGGVVVALPPVCFGVLTENKSLIGTRIGMGFAMAGLGLMASGPAAGAILRAPRNRLDWTGVWVYGGSVACASGLVFAIVRIMKSGLKLRAKV
ncbi:monocarboxylate permease [Xylaria bambusicola]|uniref:monocarboxylate permease n=1 Tax=Xylaria bambusicola TaxID=326684 RepID=UPI002007BA38|nr:monocarboxylate permease [Xylaria bambusicola]KAI0513011.1 monocarboxylate permease [Xylaria bambusicola]